jgi:hypothetical protein
MEIYGASLFRDHTNDIPVWLYDHYHITIRAPYNGEALIQCLTYCPRLIVARKDYNMLITGTFNDFCDLILKLCSTDADYTARTFGNDLYKMMPIIRKTLNTSRKDISDGTFILRR